MGLYESEDYKDALRLLMAERREQFGSRFTFEKMAERCGVQKTYLSKVLNGSGQLNPDQLYAACEFLKLKAEETDFVTLLREINLAQNPQRLERLNVRMQKLKTKQLRSEASLEVKSDLSVEDRLWEYYTDIDLQLVHLFLTVPDYASNAKLAGEKIGISASRLEAILFKLSHWNIIRFEKGKYLVDDPKLHLSEASPAFVAFAILNRVKTIEKLRNTKLASDDNYFFSAVFSADAKLQVRLKRKILEFIRQTQAEVASAKAEQVFQLNLDFFRWS